MDNYIQMPKAMKTEYDVFILSLLIILTILVLLLIFNIVLHQLLCLYPKIKNKYIKHLPFLRDKTLDVYVFIFSYFAKDRTLTRDGHGKINNLYYSKYITNNNARIYRIELDFNTRAHIIGFSKGYDIDKTLFENYLIVNDMENVVLEGDFANEFEIYVRKNQGSKTQYVLDPAAMEHIGEYCKNNFWEIVDDEMYVVYTSKHKESQNFSNEISNFIKQIRPARYEKIPRKEEFNQEKYYGEYENKPYLCPLCNKILLRAEHWLECPDHDGIMINGGHIVEINKREIRPPQSISKPKIHGILECPNCHNKMQSINYQNRNVIIDTCTHCTMRWLDSGEADKMISSLSK